MFTTPPPPPRGRSKMTNDRHGVGLEHSFCTFFYSIFSPPPSLKTKHKDAGREFKSEAVGGGQPELRQGLA